MRGGAAPGRAGNSSLCMENSVPCTRLILGRGKLQVASPGCMVTAEQCHVQHAPAIEHSSVSCGHACSAPQQEKRGQEVHKGLHGGVQPAWLTGGLPQLLHHTPAFFSCQPLVPEP